ncbi:MAG: T9SS type A sorting domain-containing protein [Ignavibacteriales bacterium]|nr:T9SS type A sorting domain-containing protein [Ignavibacteriales bacterium]
MKLKNLILLLLGLFNYCFAQASIDFHVENLEAGPAYGPWMFEMLDPHFVNDNDIFNGEYAYVALDWNENGFGNPVFCTGSGQITTSTCTAENLVCLNGNIGVTLKLQQFRLWQFHKINTVNPNANWAILGQAGDERIYGGGSGQIIVNGQVMLNLTNCRLTLKNYYPVPVGAGNQSTASGWGTIDINQSDAQWVAELDPQGTGQVEFECSSFSPIIQSCYGAYNVDIRVKGGAHGEAMAAANVQDNGAFTVALPAAKTVFDLASSVNGGMNNDENFISSNLINAAPAGTLPDSISAVSNCYWQLGTTLKQFTTDVTFDISAVTGIQSRSLLRILKRPTGTADWAVWGDVTLVDSNHITALGVNGFSEFTIGTLDGNPLPVELTTFCAKPGKMSILLNWTTATEVNNSGFFVERNHANDSWQTLGFVKGHGNSNRAHEYLWADANLAVQGIYNYRLKQIDNDGSFSYSGIVSATITNGNKPAGEIGHAVLAQNYPNPFNPSTLIEFDLPVSSLVQLYVSDAAGCMVAHLINEPLEAGIHSIRFEGSNLAGGVYYYTLKTNINTLTRKMILLR